MSVSLLWKCAILPDQRSLNGKSVQRRASNPLSCRRSNLCLLHSASTLWKSSRTKQSTIQAASTWEDPYWAMDYFPKIEYEKEIAKLSTAGIFRRHLLCALEESGVKLMKRASMGSYFGITDAMTARNFSWILTGMKMQMDQLDVAMMDLKRWIIDSWLQETMTGISIQSIVWKDSHVLAKACSSLSLRNNSSFKVIKVPYDVKDDLIPQLLSLHPYPRYAFSEGGGRRVKYKREKNKLEYTKHPLELPLYEEALVEGTIEPWAHVKKGLLRPWAYADMMLQSLPHELDRYYQLNLLNVSFTNMWRGGYIEARAQMMSEEEEQVEFQNILLGENIPLCCGSSTWTPKPGFWLRGGRIISR